LIEYFEQGWECTFAACDIRQCRNYWDVGIAKNFPVNITEGKEMAESTETFYLGQAQYHYIKKRAWIFLGACLLCVLTTMVLAVYLWQTYAHDFVFYLKWQDALVFMLGFTGFVALGGGIFLVRFLVALRKGRQEGMVTLDETENTLTIRDLSPENLWSIFWIMNASFWCFFAVQVGLVPIILIGWTLHLANPILAFFATALAGLLSLGGLVVSVIAAVFIVVGVIGLISLCRKLGSRRTYTLGQRTTLRIDNFVLTVIYPAQPESMLDLNLLTLKDQRMLLSQLYTRWQVAEQAWGPTLGEEITCALEEAERGEQSTVLI
jgi:hypothetical protein